MVADTLAESWRYLLANLLGANIWRLGVHNGEVEGSLPFLDPQKFGFVIVTQHVPQIPGIFVHSSRMADICVIPFQLPSRKYVVEI